MDEVVAPSHRNNLIHRGMGLSYAPVVISLRPMRLADVELLERWDEDPELNAQIAGRGSDWYDWDIELAREVSWRELLMIEHDGRTVGFVQLLDAAADEEGYWADVEPGTWAVDMWIGEPADRGRGVGSVAMTQALDRLFAERGAQSVLVDPLVSNDRAIAFYESVGFVGVEERVLDGDRCLVMHLRDG